MQASIVVAQHVTLSWPDPQNLYLLTGSLSTVFCHFTHGAAVPLALCLLPNKQLHVDKGALIHKVPPWPAGL